MTLPRDANGKLPAVAWPGGYSVVYLCADGAFLCPACANGENGSEASEFSEEKQWKLIKADVYWEGPTEQCAHCGRDLESEYGDPDAETKEDES